MSTEQPPTSGSEAQQLDAAALRRRLRDRPAAERLDLQGVELVGLDLSGLAFERVDLRGAVLRDVDLAGATLSDVDLRGATLREVDLTGAVLVGVGFEGARLARVRFARGRLDDCRFQGASLDRCDLRYAEVLATSFKDASLRGCDLYRSHLGSRTVFERSDLSDCSLYLAWFDGVMLPRESITEGERDGLLQEHPESMAALHEERQDRDEITGELGAVHRAQARREAADIYRRLSGYWDSLGAGRDAAWAYRRAKSLETAAWRPDRVLRVRNAVRAYEAHGGSGDEAPPALGLERAALWRATVRWLGGNLAGAVAGYGERPLRVLVTAVVWLLLIASGFGLAGEARALDDALLLAGQAMTTTAPVADLGRSGQILAIIAAAGGVVLLGLLGFTLGNRLRSS